MNHTAREYVRYESGLGITTNAVSAGSVLLRIYARKMFCSTVHVDPKIPDHFANMPELDIGELGEAPVGFPVVLYDPAVGR